jgi:hypothetical protein
VASHHVQQQGVMFFQPTLPHRDLLRLGQQLGNGNGIVLGMKKLGN